MLGIAPGAMVNQYEIIRELGRGGMGWVFLARDTALGRRIAIKFLTTAASQAVARRFAHEARTTARLNHENIVVVHEVNEHAGVPFMVLEYLEGEPLSQLVRDDGLPWPRAVELVVPIVRALARAHEHGIVHRDMKPDNVVLTRDGIIKVLDFGIAKAFGPDADRPMRAPTNADELARHDGRLTNDGAIVGTLPYMSPEQLGMGTVDARSDLWAIGVMFWELLAGRHPLAPVTAGGLFESAALLDEPMPKIGDVVRNLPDALERAVEACLEKRGDRRPSATDLLAVLEPMLPGRLGRLLAEGECPYIGLAAFQESDAARFFGRARDIVRVVARLAEQPLVAIAGPSGIGKSSFVRAGVIPALKASSDRWETFVMRPGRDPIAALASLLAPMTSSGTPDIGARAAEHTALVARLRAEPGQLGTVLRARARQKMERILLFVDQFEELYALVPSERDRIAFAACLAGVADDSATPLRVVVSIRSDFLDRVAESDRLLAEVTRGLMFLAPAAPSGLRDALVSPLELAGYRFESPAIVEDMLSALQVTPGALPLLQFVGSRLWDARDRHRKLVTVEAYRAMGGIAGALAAHADDAVAQMPADAQRVARLVFQRLVTPEGTRAIAESTDLLALAPSRDEGERVLDQLVQARLLIVQSRSEAEGAAIEIVHESLITGWPRLRRWLDESQEEAAFVAQLGTAAKQWDAAQRPAGLLWRGDAADEARRFAARSTRELPERERAYLAAVVRLSTRATRIKRIALGGVIAILSFLVVAAVAALALIRDAQLNEARAATEAKTKAAEAEAQKVRAEDEAKNARTARDVAEVASNKARAAEKESADRLREIRGKDQIVKQGRQDLDTAYGKLEQALAAEKAARLKAADANDKLTRQLREKEAELKKLQKANRPF